MKSDNFDRLVNRLTDEENQLRSNIEKVLINGGSTLEDKVKVLHDAHLAEHPNLVTVILANEVTSGFLRDCMSALAKALTDPTTEEDRSLYRLIRNRDPE